MNTDLKFNVTEIQRFCMHDGPGIRTTVFLKGCPLRCEWCHNPETQKQGSEILFYPSKCIMCGGCTAVCPVGAHELSEKHNIDRQICLSCFGCVEACPTRALERCGKEMTVSEILEAVERDTSFYGDKGGITLSGGEPFAHAHIKKLLSACKERGLSVAVETCGYAPPERLRECAPYVDLFLWDVKDTDAARHKLYTGVSNEIVLENLRLIDGSGARTRLRCILVNGINTCFSHYESLGEIYRELRGCEGVELLPYHAYGGTKSVFCGGADNGRDEWIPTMSHIEEARRILNRLGVTVL